MTLLRILEDITERKQKLTMYDIMYITIELTKIKTQKYKRYEGAKYNNEVLKRIENLYNIVIADFFESVKLEYKNFNFIHDSKVYKLYNDIYLQGGRCIYNIKNEELENRKKEFLCDLVNIGFEIEKTKSLLLNSNFTIIDITDKQFENLLEGYNGYVANYMGHSIEFQYVVTIFKEIKYMYSKK